MSMENKGRKCLALVLAIALFICLFPVVYADEPETDFNEEDVTPIPKIMSKEVTKLPRTLREGSVSYVSQ